MTSPTSLTLTPFGSLPLIDAEAVPLGPEQLTVLDWSLNGTEKALRLSVAHQRTLLIVHIYNDDSYGRELFEAVSPTWPSSAKEETAGRWCGRVPIAQGDRADDPRLHEDQLWALVREAAPRIVADLQARLGGSIAGCQFWAEVTSPPTSASTKPEIVVVGHSTDPSVVVQLPILSEAAFLTVPRVDISNIISFAHSASSSIGNDVGVCVDLPASTLGKRAILRTIQFDLPRANTSKGTSLRVVNKELFIGEVWTLMMVPSHPNVLSAPLAFVTINGNKLIGWISEKHTPFQVISLKDPSPLELATRLKYALDLCAGVRHLVRNGVYQCDLGLDSLRLSSAGRLLITNLEPRQRFENTSGPNAPETCGTWNASTGTHGGVVYIRSTGPAEDRTEHILHNWAGIPEALERLVVFHLGTTLSLLLDIRLDFPWLAVDEVAHSSYPVEPAGPPNGTGTHGSESPLSFEIVDLVRHCTAFDPRARPLLKHIIRVLKTCISEIVA